MGEYFYTMNLDKKQYLHPHKFGEGLKLLEGSDAGTLTALKLLLCSRRDPSLPLLGAWEGDRIAVVGDYADGHAGQEAHNAEGEWVDISLDAREQFGKEFNIDFGKRWDTD